jgi:phosphoenolpyruvate-protein kinase (PTS system EI component)
VKDLNPGWSWVCLESGSASAHSVILARAMGIPAVVGLGPLFQDLTPGPR